MNKISICGKGGSGKSTIVTLLARELCARGKGVLVVDSDESNAGLHRMLGFDHPPRPLLELAGGRKKVQRVIRAGFPAGTADSEIPLLQRDRIRVTDIPDGYIVRRDHMGLIAAGKIHQALEGCACPIGALTREFLKRLERAEDEIVVVDTEAGVEHFGRGLETSLDAVLAVVGPSLESILLAARINELATESRTRFEGVVMNGVPNESIRQRLASQLDNRQLPILAVIGHHSQIVAAGLTGDVPGQGAWRQGIVATVDALTRKSR